MREIFPKTFSVTHYTTACIIRAQYSTAQTNFQQATAQKPWASLHVCGKLFHRLRLHTTTKRFQSRAIAYLVLRLSASSGKNRSRCKQINHRQRRLSTGARQGKTNKQTRATNEVMPQRKTRTAWTGFCEVNSLAHIAVQGPLAKRVGRTPRTHHRQCAA